MISKCQRRFLECGATIISRYARGMKTRKIQGHTEEIYGVEVSPSLILATTDALMDDATSWQSWPLGLRCPIVFVDAIRINNWSNVVVRKMRSSWLWQSYRTGRVICYRPVVSGQRGRISADPGQDLYRTSAAPLDELRLLEGLQRPRGRAEVRQRRRDSDGAETTLAEVEASDGVAK